MILLKIVSKFPVVVSLLAVLLGFQFYDLGMRSFSPFTLHSSGLINHEVKKTERLVLVYEYTKHRWCRVDLERYVTEKVGSKVNVIFRERVPSAPQPPGYTKVENDMPLPAILESGHEYYLQVTIISQCSEGIHVDPWPVQHFKVL